MSLPAITGLLGSLCFGDVYCRFAQKFSLLSQVGLKTQKKTFIFASAIQGIFTYYYPPQSNEGFSKRKAFEVLAPYLLISGSMCFFHRQALKANAMSTVVLGTAQLAISQLAPKVASYFTNAPLRNFSPEELSFGKAEWAQFFGDVGEVPVFPEDISEILNAPCPFISGKQARETHILVLIPQKVDGKLFNLNLLNELIKAPKEKGASTFSYYNEAVKEELGEKTPSKSYWVLLTKNAVPESRKKEYEKQKALVEAKENYELPSALEAATSVLMHFFKTGETLYRKNPWTHTRCQEEVRNGWPVSVWGLLP